MIRSAGGCAEQAELDKKYRTSASTANLGLMKVYDLLTTHCLYAFLLMFHSSRVPLSAAVLDPVSQFYFADRLGHTFPLSSVTS